MGSHDIKYLPKVKQPNKSKAQKAVACAPQLFGLWTTYHIQILLLPFQQKKIKELTVKPFRFLYV
jgi:hypothetical protein